MPEDFFADTSSALRFKFLYDPRNEIESQLIQGTIQKTIFTKLPSLFPLLMQKQANSFLGDSTSNLFKNDMAEMISEYFNIDKEEVTKSMSSESINDLLVTDSATTENSSGENDFINNLIKFDSEQLVGKEIKNPGVTRIVGGWAIMFLLFTLSGVATSIFDEKQEGTLKRLFCMPVTRSEYLWAKYVYSILIGIVQLSVLFIFAYFLYDVDIFINLTNLIIVIIVSASAAVAFGMIIISLSNSLAQANGIATLLILIMSALGGSWFPVSLFPDWLQFFSKFTLTYWSVEAFLQVLWRNAPFSEIFSPYLIILLGIAIIVNFAALYFFKKRQVV
jgi:ABC-2 type transport system permease protein